MQMVALNWQKSDKGVMLNEGMFAGSGGWVLKPDALLSSERAPQIQAMDLEVKLLAAQQLQLPHGQHSAHSLRPYVKVLLHVESLDLEKAAEDQKHSRSGPYNRTSKDGTNKADGANGKMQFRSPTLRGINPDFGSFSATFSNAPVDNEALSFLRFKIMSDIDMARDALVAWACIRLDRVRAGVSVVKLFDAHGQKTDGFLLVDVAKELKPGVPPQSLTLPIRER